MPRNFECRFPCEEVLNAPINFPSPISIMGSEMVDEMMAKMTQMLVHSILVLEINLTGKIICLSQI